MIERFNVSESLSKLTDFSELDCKIGTEILIDGNFVAEFFDEFFGSFFFFCSSFTLTRNPLVKKFDLRLFEFIDLRNLQSGARSYNFCRDIVFEHLFGSFDSLFV